MKECKFCKRPISWMQTFKGKPMPVELEPVRIQDVPEGTLLINRAGQTYKAGEELRFEAWQHWFVVHWSVCEARNQTGE